MDFPRHFHEFTFITVLQPRMGLKMEGRNYVQSQISHPMKVNFIVGIELGIENLLTKINKLFNLKSRVELVATQR